MKKAHRFIDGIRSAGREADLRLGAGFSRPLHGLQDEVWLVYPAMNRWAIFERPLRGLLILELIFRIRIDASTDDGVG